MSDVTGLLAAATALGGFLGHAGLAIAGAAEMKLRRATAVGGLLGIVATVGGFLSASMLGWE
jgi:hypothetical protein